MAWLNYAEPTVCIIDFLGSWRGFIQQLIEEKRNRRQLTVEGHFRLLYVCFSLMKCVNKNFPHQLLLQPTISRVEQRAGFGPETQTGLIHGWSVQGPNSAVI